MPPDGHFFAKTVILILTLKDLVTKYTHVKYEGPKSYQSIDMANEKVLQTNKWTNGCKDKQINRWAKNYMPLIYRCWGIKIFDLSKLKAFCRPQNMAQRMELVFDRVENIVGKGENAGYQQTPSLSRLFQLCIVW